MSLREALGEETLGLLNLEVSAGMVGVARADAGCKRQTAQAPGWYLDRRTLVSAGLRLVRIGLVTSGAGA